MKDEKGRPMTYWGGLEQPAQEPVAWMYEVNHTYTNFDTEEPPSDTYDEDTLVPLYTHPRQWQGLTDDEIDAAADETDKVFATSIFWVKEFARAIEQALKEKNHGI